MAMLVYQRVCQWEFQDPKLEVPTICKAYFSGLCKGIYQQNMALYGTGQYLHFRFLKWPLSMVDFGASQILRQSQGAQSWPIYPEKTIVL